MEIAMGRVLARIASVITLTLAAHVSAQEATTRDSESRPVAAADDPVNRFVSKKTVDGLIVTVTIDGSAVTLDRATPARIPKPRKLSDKATGDIVTAAGFAGGKRVSQTTVSDQVVNAQEGVGIVRTTRRQLSFTLEAPRAIDTVEVSAPATGASARLDVRSAYAQYCAPSKPDPRLCPTAAPQPPGD
jgi:hypothetical protein